MSTKGNTLSVFSLLDAFRRRKFLIILPAILFATGFGVYAYKQPNVYRAQALVAAETLTAPEYLRDVSPEPLNIQEHLWSVREILLSPEVLAQVGADKSSVTVKVESEHTFHIGYESNDPKQVADITNKLATTFVQRASAKHQEKVADTSNVIVQQIDNLKSKLSEQDKEVKAYKQRAVEELPQNLDSNIKVAEQLKQEYDGITSKIADEESRRTTAQQQIAELERQGVLNQPTIVEKTPAQIKLDELKIQEKELTTRLMPDHPEVKRLHQQMRELEATIANSTVKPRTEPSTSYAKYMDLKSQLDGIRQRVDDYKRQQSNLMSQMATYQKRIDAAPQHERYLAEIDREYHVRESQLHDLLDKKLNTDISGNLQKSETGIAFTVAEPASEPSAPSSPQRTRMILMGLCAGLGLGLVAAFLLEQNDTTFANVDDFQGFTTVPVIAAIPTVGTAKSKPNEQIVSVSDPDSVAAEQYRVLGMKLQQQCAAHGTSVLMLTSAAGGEGKSLTAVNLAHALASMSSGPVLLIDGDMRKPKTHEYLGLKMFEGRGLYNLLQSGDTDYSRHMVKIKNLSVIPGSPPAGNPVAVLSSTKARALFEKFRQDFDYIVVDAPPTLPVADGHLLAGLSDKVLFVVRARKTPRELFQHAVESFDSTNLMGVVLNDVDYQRSRYAYAYEYYKKSA